MNYKIRAVSGLITLAAIAVFCACNKFDEVGTTILPESDNLNLVYTDTATIITSTMREDSLRANGLTGFRVYYNIVGSLNEPIFGKTKASAYMQLDLSKYNFDFGDSAKADSLILCLALNSYYGSTRWPIRFKVYRMDSLINKDSTYYTNTTVPASTLIGAATLLINPKDSLSEFGVKKTPHIRIPLNMSLATDLVHQSFADNAAFINYFKGVYITAECVHEPGCLFVFNYLNSQSKMALYYKQTADSDSLAFNYYFDELARFNHYEHDYTGSEVGNALNNNPAGYSYLQSMAGLKTKISLPYLKDYFSANPSMVINNAVLVFKVEKNTNYSPISFAVLTYVDSAGKPQTFSLDGNEIANGADGTYISSTSEYRFNITRYMSEVMSGKRTDYGIYLRSPTGINTSYASISTPNQSKLYGSNNPLGKIKLELTYTKF